MRSLVVLFSDWDPSSTSDIKTSAAMTGRPEKSIAIKMMKDSGCSHPWRRLMPFITSPFISRYQRPFPDSSLSGERPTFQYYKSVIVSLQEKLNLCPKKSFHGFSIIFM